MKNRAVEAFYNCKNLMGESLKNYSAIIFLFLCSCSMLTKGNNFKAKDLSLLKLKAAELKFKIKEDSKQIYQFRSSSHKKTYLNDQILNEKEEIVDFQLEQKATAVNEKKSLYAFDLKTISKDGFVSLKDLGFPELNKKIPYMLNDKAKVLRAGNYPLDSIYYIPMLILPDREVVKGETWDFIWDYRLMETGIPLRLKVTSILKRFLNCGLRRCADIEVSGVVELATPIEEMDYDSELAGRMIVDIDDGSILWQRIRSGETMMTEEGSIVIYSCIESKLKSPFAKAVFKDKDLDCKATPADALYVAPIEI